MHAVFCYYSYYDFFTVGLCMGYILALHFDKTLKNAYRDIHANVFSKSQMFQHTEREFRNFWFEWTSILIFKSVLELRYRKITKTLRFN